LGQQAESLIDAVTKFANAKDANGQNILRTTSVSLALIAPSVSLESGLSYNDVMVGPVGTGKDVLAIMTSIKNKLVAGNSPSDEDMVNFQAALTQVTRAQVKTGLLQNQLEAATEAAEVQKTNVELQRSNLLDTDLATATASLVKSNALLQAAQSVMTKLDVNTLFQKL
jgi:flagellin-like hook-associated protein FlgL